MQNKFFIGDLHIGDETIIQLENRPFANAEEQTIAFIKNWNSVVEDNDIVYVMGDYIVENPSQFHINELRKLKGRKFLVKGNHDTLPDEVYIEKYGFEKVYDTDIIIDGFWILSHEPKYVNKNFPYANIFAHVHGNPIYKTHSCRHYCVSVERINNTPISFNEIKNTVFEDDKNKS